MSSVNTYHETKIIVGKEINKYFKMFNYNKIGIFLVYSK